MVRSTLLGLGGLVAVLGMIGVAVLGSTTSTEAMPPSVFRVTITNMTDPPTPISPGALVGHCEDGSLWAVGGQASAELELIAEVGSPSAAVAVNQDETAMGMSFVQERYQIGDVAPGASTSVEVIFEFGCKLSSAHMLVLSNDTFVGANSVGMWDPDTHLPLDSVSVDLMAYDAGTEANSDPGSGFEGGQPDPARGEENLDNGEATDEAISASTQWTGVQARMTIEYITEDPASKKDEEESTMEAEGDATSDGSDDSMSEDEGTLMEAEDAMDEGDDDSMMEDDDSMDGADDDSMMDEDEGMMEDDDSMDEADDDSMMDEDEGMMEDDDESMSQDEAADEHIGAPNTGSGGLADAGSGLGIELTGLLAAASVVLVGLGAIGVRRRSAHRS